MFLLEISIDETAPRSLKTPRSDCSPLRHHLEGTPTCGKFVGPKPAASRYTRNFFARRARSLFFGSMPRTASRIIQSDFDSRNLFAGTSFKPPGYPLCE